ncbi:CaiB/BaiF CoA transferase family protein [Pseudorhodoferax sp.]|uniref:CaiB/BaiF CoA transferase family protein n=1 Tax=Pseudorhodoferax sp. TaxID=1993553 RepID=UPI002DD64A70|nr:CoA transferase [Pseudorhodoferax sp.]
MSTTACTSTTVWKPLEGVRIADFSVLFPGPFATTLLADLGADVVKIEAPTGDPGRAMLPELFQATGRNKRSVVLDLKSPQDRAQIAAIAAWADIVIEGFRPGVADRLGIGFEQLQAFNAKLVYCSLSGYGQDGPWKDRPGHDLNYLAAGGALGHSAMYGRLPGRSSVPLGDICGGALAATSILAALRERDRSGAPARLDLSVFEATLYCAALRHGTTGAGDTGLFPGNDIYAARDGVQVTLALVEDHFWRAFQQLLGHELPALRDARFDTMHGRRQHGSELAPLLEQLLASRSAREWAALFAGSDIPFEICVSPAQAARSEHVRARGRLVERAGQTFVPFPVTVDGRARPTVRAAAPGVGEHTTAFLGALRPA